MDGVNFCEIIQQITAIKLRANVWSAGLSSFFGKENSFINHSEKLHPEQLGVQRLDLLQRLRQVSSCVW